MKTKICITIFLFTALGMLRAQDSLKTYIGPHGGTVKKANNYFSIEILTSAEKMHTYLLNKKRKTIPNKELKCAAKLFFYDNTSTDVSLKPLGDEGFSIELSALKFSSCRITFTISGKDITAKFQNESLIVEKK